MPRAANSAAGAKPAPKKRRANAYKMPDPLPLGEVLTDIRKKQWSLGQSVGKGGFGEIYLAKEHKDGASKGEYSYVIKIEPHENGPLFCELHFYQRAAKPESIDGWKRKHKLAHLGVPKYIASGQHEHGSTKYRFLVMERFGEDLLHKLKACHHQFSPKLTYTIAIQIVDALEYLHSYGYAHADIKGANLLLGYGTKAKDQVFLVDFGLASRYMPDGSHRKYDPNPKKAHDGTLEYTSRDAHHGVSPSRRADFEILGYNLVHWLSGKLPWNGVSKEVEVQSQKEKHMSNIDSFLSTCFGKEKFAAELKEYLKYVEKLKYDETPDYSKVKDLFKKAIVASGSKNDGKLVFDTVSAKSPSKRSPSKSPAKRASSTPRGAAKTAPKKAASKPAKRKSNSDIDEENDTDDAGDAGAKKRGRKVASSSGTETPSPRKRAVANDMEKKVPKNSPKAVTKPKKPTKREAAPTKQLATKKRKRKVESTSIATQTSPGLKGLKKPRKKAGN